MHPDVWAYRPWLTVSLSLWYCNAEPPEEVLHYNVEMNPAELGDMLSPSLFRQSMISSGDGVGNGKVDE